MDITNPIFQDADKARDHLESVRWPEGPVCPHCGGTERIGKMEGKSTRPGVYKCYHCRKPFSVTVGTWTVSSSSTTRTVITDSNWKEEKMPLAWGSVGVSSLSGKRRVKSVPSPTPLSTSTHRKT